MAASVYYFTGENSFALREEKLLWTRQFVERHGSENLTVVQGKELPFRVLLDEVGSAPFIAAKRLVVIEGTPAFEKEEVRTLPSLMHPDCILAIVDATPDRRLAAVKAFLEIAEVKEFPALRGGALTAWIARFAASLGASLDAPASFALVAAVGEDQEFLAQELRKLALYASGRSLSARDVELLCTPSGEQEVWRITQFIADRRIPDALRYARSLLDRGEDPYAVWNYLLWMLRMLGAVRAAVEDGNTHPARIASQYNVPPMSARTLLGLAHAMPLRAFGAFLAWAVEADIALKTGGFRATREAPQELAALIDGFILRCSNAAQ